MFSDPDFDIHNGFEDVQRSGRPEKLVSDDLEALLEEDSGLTTRQMADFLGVDQSTIVRRLNTIGKIHKAGRWVPHKLSDHNKIQRLNTSIFLLSKQKRKSFLHQIVTGDETGYITRILRLKSTG